LVEQEWQVQIQRLSPHQETGFVPRESLLFRWKYGVVAEVVGLLAVPPGLVVVAGVVLILKLM
jgi:hypothetical protein